MKTRTSGQARQSRSPPSVPCGFDLFGPAFLDYKKKRNNLEPCKDAPPKDGKFTWVKGRVEGSYVYGEKLPNGKYDYEVRYDEGPKDREWMENNDKVYLRQLVAASTLRQKEPEVWYLYEMDKAKGIDTSDIGEWWVGKLAEVRRQGEDIAIVLQNAERDYRQFIASGQQCRLEEQERLHREEMERIERERQAEELKRKQEEARRLADEEKRKQEQQQKEREEEEKERIEKQKRLEEERRRKELEEQKRQLQAKEEPEKRLKEKHKQEEQPKEDAVIDRNRLADSLIIRWTEIMIEPEDEKHPLGRGGFGTVYKGTCRYSDVAIKRLHLQELTEAIKSNFAQEAQLMAELRSPYIVPLIGICLDEGNYCMVMEYMANGTLWDVLHDEKRELLWNLRLKIAREICLGLAVLHGHNQGQGIIHRDLKSPNVLLDDGMKARLGDFGLAKLKETSEKCSKIAGTFSHMSPELFDGQPATKASDIYALGMIFWEISSRQKPFADATPAQIMGRILRGQNEEVPPDCPPKFARLITRCWEERSERPTIEAVIEDLGRITIIEEINSSSKEKPKESKQPLLSIAQYEGNVERKGVSRVSSSSKCKSGLMRTGDDGRSKRKEKEHMRSVPRYRP